MNKIKIEWVCDSPSHYNDFLFNGVHQNSEEQMDFEVNYMRGKVKSHPWKSRTAIGYKSRVFEKLLGVDWCLIKKGLRANGKTVFVVASWSDFTSMILIMILALRNEPFIIWTDTPRLVSRHNRLMSRLRSIWILFVFKNARFIMGTGKMALSRLKKMGCIEEKLINLPYFTDINLYTPTKKDEITEEKLIFLSSGRLINDRKAFDHAINAFIQLKTENPKLNIQYRIAGQGPSFDELKKLVIENKLDDSILFLGWLEPLELIDFYNSGDIYIHPAIYEPYGVAVLEAMSCGLAIIGSDNTGAVIDRIEDGENGFIFKTGDVHELKERMSRLINDEVLLLNFKEQSRKTSIEWPVTRGVSIINKLVNSCLK